MGKKKKYSLYQGENLSFWKNMGGGQNYHNLGNYTPMNRIESSRSGDEIKGS